MGIDHVDVVRRRRLSAGAGHEGEAKGSFDEGAMKVFHGILGGERRRMQKP
jgi:hypothetical protein